MSFTQDVIEWEDVKVGETYRYEEKYDLQAEVVVLNKRVLNDEEHDDYLEIELKVVKSYYGCDVGEKFNCGRTSGRGMYFSSSQLFMTLDSWFSYYTPGYKGE